MQYRGKVAVVTGASSGIGKQIALDGARRGVNLAIVARRTALLEEVAAECRTCGVAVEALAGDLAERTFAESVVTHAVERFGRLDILVNNAGIPKHPTQIGLARLGEWHSSYLRHHRVLHREAQMTAYLPD